MTTHPSSSLWRRLAGPLMAVLLLTAATASQGQMAHCEATGGRSPVDRPCTTSVDAAKKAKAAAQGVKPKDVTAGKPRVATGTHASAQPDASRGATRKLKPRRDPKAVAAFRKLKPCPATGKKKGACPGYEIDHVVPLAAGGADAPSNMQWLTRQQHRAKTKRERTACVYGCRP